MNTHFIPIEFCIDTDYVREFASHIRHVYERLGDLLCLDGRATTEHFRQLVAMVCHLSGKHVYDNVKLMVQDCPATISYIPAQYRSDRDLLKELISVSPLAFDHLLDKEDLEEECSLSFIQEMITKEPSLLPLFYDRYDLSESFIKKMLIRHPNSIKSMPHLPRQYYSDESFMMDLVALDPSILCTVKIFLTCNFVMTHTSHLVSVPSSLQSGTTQPDGPPSQAPFNPVLATSMKNSRVLSGGANLPPQFLQSPPSMTHGERIPLIEDGPVATVRFGPFQGCAIPHTNQIRPAEHPLFENRGIALAAVKKKGQSLEWFSDRIKMEREIVLEAITNDPLAYIHSHLKDCEEITLVALTRSPLLVRHIPTDMNYSSPFRLKAVRANPRVLIWAEAWRYDTPVMIEAIRASPSSLLFLPMGMRSRLATLIPSLELPEGIEYPSSTAVMKRVIYQLKERGYPLSHLPYDLAMDPETALMVFEEEPGVRFAFADSLKNNPDFILSLLRRDPARTDMIPQELRADRSFMLRAIKCCVLSVRVCDSSLLSDKTFIMEAIEGNHRILHHLPPSLYGDEDITLRLIQDDSLMFGCLDERITKNQSLMRKINKECGLFFYFTMELLNERLSHI